MTTELYFKFFFAAFLGWLIQVCVKQASLMAKAKAANVRFSPLEYFTEDYWAIGATFAFIGICLLAVDMFIHLKPWILAYLAPTFAFVGYTGSDLALRIFSTANKKLNKAIDYKTNIVDEQNGTLGTPTPK